MAQVFVRFQRRELWNFLLLRKRKRTTYCITCDYEFFRGSNWDNYVDIYTDFHLITILPAAIETKSIFY